MITRFRETMIRQFEMAYMGLMSYFLGIKVIQQNDGIFISQKKYAGDILKKFKMEHSKPVYTPIEEKLKLTRENDGKWVDITYYKSLIKSSRYLTATRLDIVLKFAYIADSWKNRVLAICKGLRGWFIISKVR